MFASSSPLNRRLLGGINPVVPDDGTENNPALMRSQMPGMMFRGFEGAAPVPRADTIGAADRSLAMPPPDLTAINPDLTNATVQKPGFFKHGGLGEKILGGVGEFALRYSASQGNPFAMATIQNRLSRQRAQDEAVRQDQLRQQDRQWQIEDRDAMLNKPQFFNAGNDRVRYDPTTGQSEVVYDAPEDYQTYASTLGLNPGDAGYDNAVQDYVLRGSGPTAQKAKLGLEGVRQDNRLQLRGTPTYLQAHPAPPRPRASAGPRAPSTMGGVVAPILAKMAQGQPLSAGEQQALSTYQAGRGGHRGGGGRSGGGSMPTVRTPAEARALPPGTRFRTPDGREMVR